MSILEIQFELLALDVTLSDDALHVILADGREVSAPLVWFPILKSASNEQRQDWQLIGGGLGIHWESIDEDVSVESLLRSE